MSELRIRKLTPVETGKLMGFTREDYEDMKKVVLSDSAIMHCHGDSIVVSVLIGIFGQMIDGIDVSKTIQDYVQHEIVEK